MFKGIFGKVLFSMLLVVLLTSYGLCAEVNLAWDANATAPEGYRIFMAQGDAPFDYAAPAWQGATTSCTVADLAEGTTYRFVARAYVGALESADSNVVVYTVPVKEPAVIYQQQPRRLVIEFN
jgi:hypothetical protein